MAIFYVTVILKILKEMIKKDFFFQNVSPHKKCVVLFMVRIKIFPNIELLSQLFENDDNDLIDKVFIYIFFYVI
jgi:hypothetical protein